MRIYSILFWAAAGASIWWCGTAFVNGSVYAAYHPMAALGDRMYAFRTGSVVIPIVIALTVLILWLGRRPLAPRFYIIGLVPLALAATLTFLPKVESGHEQIYWLEDQRHSIPWVYGPYNGQSWQGGDYFLIRVWGAELTPYYQGSQYPMDYFVLEKAIAFNYGKGGPSAENNCVADEYNFRCAWKKGEYVYAMSIRADNAPMDPQPFYQPVEELLNSFEVNAH